LKRCERTLGDDLVRDLTKELLAISKKKSYLRELAFEAISLLLEKVFEVEVEIRAQDITICF
jgi:hypothetical protein